MNPTPRAFSSGETRQIVFFMRKPPVRAARQVANICLIFLILAGCTTENARDSPSTATNLAPTQVEAVASVSVHAKVQEQENVMQLRTELAKSVRLTVALSAGTQSEAVANIVLYNDSAYRLKLRGLMSTRDLVVRLTDADGKPCPRTAEGRRVLFPESNSEAAHPFVGIDESGRLEYVMPGEHKSWTVDLAKCFAVRKGRYFVQTMVKGIVESDSGPVSIQIEAKELEVEL